MAGPRRAPRRRAGEVRPGRGSGRGREGKGEWGLPSRPPQAPECPPLRAGWLGPPRPAHGQRLGSRSQPRRRLIPRDCCGIPAEHPVLLGQKLGHLVGLARPHPQGVGLRGPWCGMRGADLLASPQQELNFPLYLYFSLPCTPPRSSCIVQYSAKPLSDAPFTTALLPPSHSVRSGPARSFVCLLLVLI